MTKGKADDIALFGQLSASTLGDVTLHDLNVTRMNFVSEDTCDKCHTKEQCQYVTGYKPIGPLLCVKVVRTGTFLGAKRKFLNKVFLPSVFENRYKLVAFVSYFSDSIDYRSGGHYVAVINHGEKGWYLYDDNSITPITNMNRLSEYVTRVSFALYYKKNIQVSLKKLGTIVETDNEASCSQVSQA